MGMIRKCVFVSKEGCQFVIGLDTHVEETLDAYMLGTIS